MGAASPRCRPWAHRKSAPNIRAQPTRAVFLTLLPQQLPQLLPSPPPATPPSPQQQRTPSATPPSLNKPPSPSSPPLPWSGTSLVPLPPGRRCSLLQLAPIPTTVPPSPYHLRRSRNFTKLILPPNNGPPLLPSPILTKLLLPFSPLSRVLHHHPPLGRLLSR